MLRKRMTEEFWNQGYVIMVRNKALLSSIRFCRGHAKRVIGEKEGSGGKEEARVKKQKTQVESLG